MVVDTVDNLADNHPGHRIVHFETVVATDKVRLDRYYIDMRIVNQRMVEVVRSIDQFSLFSEEKNRCKI